MKLTTLMIGVAAVVGAMGTAGGAAAQKPNIVYIMVDDLGYGSLSSYGANPSLIDTPAIDSLATDGMRFTQANTPSAVCSPTRYGVLMGEYPFRSNRQSGVVNINDALLPDENQQTMADWLKGQGYNTSAVGKWHLGFQDQNRSAPTVSSSGGWLNAANDALDPGPRALGFDYYFGVPHNNDDRTGAFVENEGIYQLQSQSIDANPGTNHLNNTYFGFDVPSFDVEDVTQTLTDKAVDWLDQQSGSSDPFFMYFNPVAVHQPIEPSSGFQNSSGAGPYGDFIQELDDSVGQVLAKLEDMGVDDNTLVIFTSDNGGHLPGDLAEPEWEAEDTLEADSGNGLNGPFRGDKQEIWEGGTRVPFLARLPGTIAAGSTSDQVINLVDSWATIAELVDPADPVDTGAAVDSESFLDSLLDASVVDATRAKISASTHGILAIRKGDWKYIEGVPAAGATPPSDEAQPQLYNLAIDPGETNNMLSSNPTLTALLQAELDLIRESSTLDAPTPGDLNGDGALDNVDIQLFAANWKTDTTGMTVLQMHNAGDIDLDGRTDLEDWYLMRAAFDLDGASAPASFRAAVPEPAAGLIGLCLLPLLAARRTR